MSATEVDLQSCVSMLNAVPWSSAQRCESARVEEHASHGHARFTGYRGNMQRIPGKSVEELTALIEALPQVETSRSPYEVIEQLAPTILAAQQRGQTLDSIVPVLAEAGIHLKRSTVRNYLRRAQVQGVSKSQPLASSSRTRRKQTMRPSTRPVQSIGSTADGPWSPQLDSVRGPEPNHTRPEATALVESNTKPAVLKKGHFAVIPDSETI
jgi:hypothetical protein